MVALAYLAALRKAAIGGVDPMNLAAELLPLTVPKVRHLLWQWSVQHRQIPPPSCIGQSGAENISNAHAALIGTTEHSGIRVKPGCSTRAAA
jgi:hypothetical protein